MIVRPLYSLRFLVLSLFLGLSMYSVSSAQLYSTDKGHIKFFSSTPVEDIAADNRGVSSVLNSSTGALMFKLLIKNFKFENSLMQEHFNENYMESEKYPASEFKGTILEVQRIDFTKPGKHNVTVSGDLTIHGVKNAVKHPGTLEILSDGSVKAFSKFPVKVADYKIKIPSIVFKNIAEVVEVTVDMNYAPVKK